MPVLGEMERHGVKVDRQALSRLSGDFAQRMAALEEEIYGLAGGRVQPRQPQAARRGALRPDGPRRRAQGQDRRLYHRRRRAGGAGGAGPRPAGADARLAAALQAEVHLHRHAAGRDQPGDRAGAHLLPDRRGGHRAAGLDRARTCRTSRSAPRRAGASARPSWRSRGTCWSASTIRQIELRILAHIAEIDALSQAFHDGHRHPRADRVADVRGAGRGDAGDDPPPGQGDQLRGDLRHLRLRPRQQPAHPARGRQAVHRHLLRALPRHPRVHGPHHRLRQGARPRGDAVRPAHPHARRSTPAGRMPASPAGRRSTRRSRARPPTSSAGR